MRDRRHFCQHNGQNSGEKRMRIFKLTLITLAAVIAFSASAWAITVKKRIEAPGLPNEV
jgi:hypothetical protein